MPLELKPCTPADFPRVNVVEKAAFAHDKFAPILFPGPFPADTGQKHIEQMISMLEKDPTTVWLKVVDSNNTAKQDEGVAFAKWNIYKDAPPGPRQTRVFGAGCNIPACNALFGGLGKQRARLLGDTRCVYLHVLVTDPSYQRRGAGSLLLQWGVDKAKELDLPLYLESSMQAHELYKKFGFEDLEMFELDMSPYGGQGFHQTYAMMAGKK